MAGENTYFESDGLSVDVDLLYEVDANQLVVVDGWLGIAEVDGESGDTIALNVDLREYQLTVPSGLSVAKGEIIYIEIADLTGHDIDDSAYSTSAGSGKVALGKATTEKDVNNVVTFIMFPQTGYVS